MMVTSVFQSSPSAAALIKAASCARPSGSKRTYRPSNVTGVTFMCCATAYFRTEQGSLVAKPLLFTLARKLAERHFGMRVYRHYEMAQVSRLLDFILRAGADYIRPESFSR